MTSLSVVGLGKLGVCTAACLAYRGYETIGLDIDAETIAKVNAGVAPVHEPRLQEVMTQTEGRLRATNDYNEILEESDVTFFIVPTPSREDGHFSDAYLRETVRLAAAALKQSKKTHHLFVITSTVTPGTVGGALIPIIEGTSGRRLNEGFAVCYNPEFIALGSVIADFLNPDLVLIGESSRAAGDSLEAIYRTACENAPRVSRMSIVSAEIAKLSLNAYVTMKISFANTLAQLCAAVPEADLDAITAALGSDRRVSPHALRGGLAYGGPCFPRDTLAFQAFAQEHGVPAHLARATHEVNLDQSSRLVELVASHSQAVGGEVAILGVAYKPSTPVIDESAAVALIEALVQRQISVSVYDHLALDNLRLRIGDEVRYASSVADAIRGASTIVVASPEFSRVNGADLGSGNVTIIDCWRVLDARHIPTSVRVIQFGRFYDSED